MERAEKLEHVVRLARKAVSEAETCVLKQCTATVCLLDRALRDLDQPEETRRDIQ